MRWMVYIALGLAGGCSLGIWCLRGWGLLLLAGSGLVLALGLTHFGKGRSLSRLAGAVALGFAVGCGWFFFWDSWYLTPARVMDGTTQEITFTATDDSWQTDYGLAVDGKILVDGTEYAMRLYLDGEDQICPGDCLTLCARMRFTDEGGSCQPTFHRSNGILLLGYQDGEILTHTPGEGKAWIPRLRRAIETRLEEFFPEKIQGFVRGLLLGDKREMDFSQKKALRLTGLSHIVAVSGLHVSMVFGLIYTLTGKRRSLTALVGIPAVLVFAAVAGFSPSITRAAVMQIMMMVALVLGREYDPPTALATAVVGMVLWNPLVLSSAGFQLSVASVAGIYLCYPRILSWAGKKTKGKKGFFPKLWHRVFQSAGISISATILTTPLVAYYYGVVSLVGVVANLLVLPVVSMIFYGIMATLAVSLVVPNLARLLAQVVTMLSRYAFALAGWLSELPLAALYVKNPYVVIWLVGCYGLLAWICLTKPRWIWPGMAWTLVALFLALGLNSWENQGADYQVTVLNVGQGQSVILQSQGKTYLVDCGGDEDEEAGTYAGETLRSMGIRQLDGLILTHYDRDHAGGVCYLAQYVSIRRLYLPDLDQPGEYLETILQAVPQGEVDWVHDEMELSVGGSQIRLFPPNSQKSGNESCVAVLFQNEKYDTLITGDLDAAGERRLLQTASLPDLELLVVGHHGSGTATCAELLYRTAPDIAVISVGRDNSYGHPAQTVLDRLERYGIRVFRTNEMGDVTFKG